MSGRRAEAVRNDRVILDAAREVFVADPKAPISAVAGRAGVGIGALYRRYGSKEDLLRRLAADGLAVYIAVVGAALADEGDPWEAFANFMRRIVDADTHSLTLRLAGTFSPTEELFGPILLRLRRDREISRNVAYLVIGQLGRPERRHRP